MTVPAVPSAHADTDELPVIAPVALAEPADLTIRPIRPIRPV